MKIKNLFMMFAIGAFALTSCNKDDATGGGDESGENFDFYMQFDISSSTKADTEEVADGTAVTFSNGALFFADASDDIVRMVMIGDAPAGAVSPSQLKAGYLFSDVDKSAVKVYVVGNYDFYLANNQPRTFADMDEVRALTVNILSQTDAVFGVSAATLYGAGDIVPCLPGSEGAAVGAEKEAIFYVSPLIARLEIDKITGKGDITGYSLAGIYINNFYYDMTIVPEEVVPSTLTLTNFSPTWGANAAEAANYTRDTHPGGNGKYQTNSPTWYEYLFDDGGDDSAGANTGAGVGLGTGTLAYTPTNDTWAYNVFADGKAVPNIIIHLKDVEVNNSPYSNSLLGGIDEAYITVTGYIDLKTGGDAPILGGYVYKLQDIEFDEDDLDEVPYIKADKNPVYVRVIVRDWTVVYVGWK